MFNCSSLCDAIQNYKSSAHLHNICMDFPQFQSENVTSTRNAILRKLITVKTYFLQLHVPYTLLSAISKFLNLFILVKKFVMIKVNNKSEICI